jgi:hypothetical protein
MLQRLIIAVATIAALSVSMGSRDASAAGHGAGLGGAGRPGGAGSAWHGSSIWHGAASRWHKGSAWHGGKDFSDRRWHRASVGWGFYDPFIGYPYFGYSYAESPYVLQCFRRIRVETLYGVSWQRVWVCN